MGGIEISGFGHVGIRVHDLDRSLRFYELLGFRKLIGPVGPEPVAILSHPAGIEINLVLNAPDAEVPNPLMDVPEKLPGYTHIALVCADVDAAEAALAAAGFPKSGEMAMPNGMRAIFVRDPDRNVIELDQMPAGKSHRDLLRELEERGSLD